MRVARVGLIVGIAWLLLVGGLSWGVFHSQASTRATEQPDPDAPLARYRGALDEAEATAFTLGHTPGEWAQSNKVLVAALADPLFARLGKTEQAGVYSGAGWAALRLDENARARHMLAQAVKLDPDASEDWHLLAQTQAYLNDYEAAATTLITYVRRWPTQLNDDKDFIARVIDGAEAGSTPRLQLLQALFRANWNPEPVGVSGVWKELALSNIRLGRREDAREVITHITAPGDLVGVRSDRRFDGLFNPNEPRFQVEAAAVRRADLMRAFAQSHPKDLQPEVELAGALLALGRNEEVLDRADRALTRVQYGDGPFKHASQKSRLMYVRSQALTRLGRFQEAQLQLEQAAKPDDQGKADVNQALNLGELYCSLGRADDALAAARSARDMNDFGKGVQAYVQHCAALLKHDPVRAERALAFLRAHKKDNEGPLLLALLRGNRIDEAAKSVIDRLAAEDTRNDTLVELQDYPQSTPPPGTQLMSARWDALAARNDVMRAVEQVGRIQHYDYYGE